MLEMLIDARQADLGHGLAVRRILPFAKRRMVGPFIFLDHAGPVVFADAARARKADVRPHPHIGLATVSYLMSGAITHRDSLAVEQVIRPGDVNWMTAGSGISHSERFEDSSVYGGAGLELLQSWVALPKDDEETEPAFDHYPVHMLPEARDAGLWLRVIAGRAFGLASPVKTHSPLFYVHLQLAAGTSFELPTGYEERAAYVVRGRIQVGDDYFSPGQLLVFGADPVPALTARDDSVVMLLGGDALGPRHIWWNFVSSSRERIEQAKADWRAGRIALPPHDHAEFIPLPEENLPRPPAQAL